MASRESRCQGEVQTAFDGFFYVNQSYQIEQSSVSKMSSPDFSAMLRHIGTEGVSTQAILGSKKKKVKILVSSALSYRH